MTDRTPDRTADQTADRTADRVAGRPHHLGDPPGSPAAQRLYDEDVEQLGFVMNGSRLWAHAPELHEQLFELLAAAEARAGLTPRQKAVLIAATASTLGDSYCSLAWGLKLARLADPELAAGVLAGDDERLDPAEQALARWARQLVRDPNAAGADDLEPLRQAGFDDARLLAASLFVGLRVAFATVNDGLGARPDAQLRQLVPEAVRRASPSGRPIAGPAGVSAPSR